MSTKQTSKSLTKVFFYLTLLFFFGCSQIFPSSNDGAKTTLLGLSNAYLQGVATGNYAKMHEFVLWSDFLSKEGNNITDLELRAHLANMQNRWSIEEHPLSYLVAKDVDLSGNNATVYLKKKDGGYSSPTIEITFHWVGAGWMIVDDNLFGKDELVDQWLAQSNSAHHNNAKDNK
jgi:hypothetical protein